MGNVHMEAAQVNYRGGSKKMSVEEAIKKAGSEITPEEKTWIDSIPALTNSNAGKTDQTVIAPEFDAEAGVYAVGDLVMYDGKLYEFTTAHETPGDWDETEVTEKTVSDEIDSLKSGLTDLNGRIIVLTTTAPTTINDYVEVAMPSGCTFENTAIVGHCEYRSANNAWYGNNAGIMVDGTNDNVAVTLKSDVFAGKSVKVFLYKFA